MYITLIIIFLLLLAIIIPGMQNNTLVTVKFFFWEIEATLTAVLFYAAIVGAAIMAILVLPKLARKYLDARSLRKELTFMKENAVEKKVTQTD